MILAQMQIAGTICRVCGKNIVVSGEGKFCAQCKRSAHLGCDSGATCAVCGQAYEIAKEPEENALSEAVLPRALRPNRGAGLAVASLVGVVFFLLWLC